MVTLNLNIDGIEARSRDEATAAVNAIAAEALSGAVGYEMDDLVVTDQRAEPVGGAVTVVPTQWHAHLVVRPHF